MLLADGYWLQSSPSGFCSAVDLYSSLADDIGWGYVLCTFDFCAGTCCGPRLGALAGWYVNHFCDLGSRFFKFCLRCAASRSGGWFRIKGHYAWRCDFWKHTYKRGLNLHISHCFFVFDVARLKGNCGLSRFRSQLKRYYRRSRRCCYSTSLPDDVNLVRRILFLSRSYFVFWRLLHTFLKWTSAAFCSSCSDFEWRATYYRVASGCVLHYDCKLLQTESFWSFMKILFRTFSLWSSPHLCVLATRPSAYCAGRTSNDWI